MQHCLEKTPEAEYQALMRAGELKPDADQAKAVTALERLHRELIDYPAISNKRDGVSLKNWWFARFLRWPGSDKAAPKGIYLHGGAGRGKSMLMDLFYSVAPITSKRRIHFHEFMLDIHARLKEWHDRSVRVKRGGRADEDDPMPFIAQQIASEATLLCFDELQVTDIADAMILTRLFKELFAQGVIVVATSNRPPADLYKHGLNRQRFQPFIAKIKEQLEIIPLEGPVDYRYNRLKGVETYYFPINEKTTAQLSAAFFRLTDRSVEDRAKVPSETLSVQGRTVFVPKAARGVAVFSFKRLCANPLGPADYLAIARAYHTVIVVAIPQFSRENSDEARRFVTFIDALYENGVKFLCSAAAPPQSLYTEGEVSFEFERTSSRLMEMQSESYLASGHCRTVAV